MEKDLPKSWSVEKLYEVTTPVKTNAKKYEGIKPYCSTGSIKENIIIIEGEYTYENRPSRANREVQVGDVLQARMSNTDKALIINDNLKEYLFSTGFIQLRTDKENIDSKYIYYFGSIWNTVGS